jgi:cell division protein FtsI (penicillin-binding protein 3)
MGTTLLQLARAYARLASGNLSLDLKLVENPKEERSSPPFEDELTSPVKRISLATLKVLREVVEMGTGRRAMIPGLDIAGKTGTAQKADPQGGYAPDRYVALFVGVFPAESPRWVVAILVDEPKKEIYGGVVAAPVFREIALRIALKEGLLNQNPTSKVSSRSGLQREGRKKLKGVYDPELLLSQEDKIPDFKGVPLRLAGRIARSLGLIVIVEGKGFVHEQHPPPGAPLRKGTRLYLKLAEG